MKVGKKWEKHIQSVSPRGVSPLGWNQNMPLMCEVWNPPCSNCYLPTRRDPVFSRFILVTEQGLPNLDLLWRSMKYLNQAQLKQTQGSHLSNWWFLKIPSLFTPSKWFQRRFVVGVLLQVSQHQTPAPCLGRSAVITREVHCSRFGVAGYHGNFLICIILNLIPINYPSII